MYKILILVISFFSLNSLDVPFLFERVIDLTNTISSSTKSELNETLRKHEVETSNQIQVLIIPSLEGEVLEDYSFKVANTWKLGQKNKNNGVLLLIVKNDRKLRIEVGSGLEGALTDVYSSRIIRNHITPEFKKGNFDEGLKIGINKIISTIKGEFKPSKDENPLKANELFFVVLVFILILAPFSFIAIFGSGFVSWFLCFFLVPFYSILGLVIFGVSKNAIYFLVGILLLHLVLRIIFKHTSIAANSSFQKKAESFSNSSSGGSFSGGGYSGGGGSFSGGGSSGSW